MIGLSGTIDYGVCPYCGSSPQVDPSPEHVIPRSLGGRGLPPVSVCSKCNHQANRRVDMRLLADPHVARARVRLGIGSRHVPERVQHRPVEFTVEEPGFSEPVLHRAFPVEGPEGLELLPGLAVTESPEGFRVVGDEGKVERQLDKIRRKLRAEGKSFTETRRAEVVTVNAPIPRPAEGGLLYVLFTAKVALALAPALLGPEIGPSWIGGQQANELRAVLKATSLGDADESGASLAVHPFPDGAQRALTLEDRHLVALVPGERGTVLAVCLFGRLIGAARVLEQELPVEKHYLIAGDPTDGESWVLARLLQLEPYLAASEGTDEDAEGA